MKNHLILGNWNALCDSCGRKFKALDLQRRWDGLMVCKEDYELRHPSDFLRVQKERIAVPFSRPYPTLDSFIEKFGFVDTLVMSDGPNTYIDPTYFAEDYIADFWIRVTFNRPFSDSLSLSEAVSSHTTKVLADTLAITENISLLLNLTRTFTDTITPSDSGYILLKNYVDVSYFSEDYVGTITSF